MKIINRLWESTVWYPTAIDPNEWESRSLRRFWLPLFDIVLIAAGIWAFAFGSPILHALFEESIIDVAGLSLSFSALICLIGVIIPRLWPVELMGKIILLGLLGGYTFAVAAFRLNPDPSAGFICFILVAAMIFPTYRLNLIGEEIKNKYKNSDTTGRSWNHKQ